MKLKLAAHEAQPSLTSQSAYAEWAKRVGLVYTGYASLDKVRAWHLLGIQVLRWFNSVGLSPPSAVTLASGGDLGAYRLRDSHSPNRLCLFKDYEAQMPHGIAQISNSTARAEMKSAMNTAFRGDMVNVEDDFDGAMLDNTTHDPAAVNGLLSAQSGTGYVTTTAANLNSGTTTWAAGMRLHLKNAQTVLGSQTLMDNPGRTTFQTLEGLAYLKTLDPRLMHMLENIEFLIPDTTGTTAKKIIDCCRQIPNVLVGVARQVSQAQFTNAALHIQLAAFMFVCGGNRQSFLAVQPGAGKIDYRPAYPAMDAALAKAVEWGEFVKWGTNGTYTRSVVTTKGTLTVDCRGLKHLWKAA